MKNMTSAILTTLIVLMIGGCVNISDTSMVSQPTRTLSRHIEKFKQGCDTNIAQDCAFLGYNYEIGKDIKQSYTQAASYYQKAIRLGDIDSYSTLARLYIKGLGVEKNYYMAAKLYEKSSLYNNGTL